MLQGAGTGRKHARGAAAREKEAIDSARTGDKIPGFDPASAPLGTDEESAGNRFSPDPKNNPVPKPPKDLAADPASIGRKDYLAQDRMIVPVIAVLSALGLAGVVATALLKA